MIHSLKEQYDLVVRALVGSAGLDAAEDNRIRGYLQGLNEFFHMKAEDLPNQEDLNQDDEY